LRKFRRLLLAQPTSGRLTEDATRVPSQVGLIVEPNLNSYIGSLIARARLSDSKREEQYLQPPATSGCGTAIRAARPTPLSAPEIRTAVGGSTRSEAAATSRKAGVKKVKAALRAALRYYRFKNLLRTVLFGVVLGRLFSMVCGV
jgi:hypothetical protein